MKDDFRNIVLLSPTIEEIEPLLSDSRFYMPRQGGEHDGRIPVIISGVGMCATAGSLAETFRRYDPDLIILAGVAGAYPWSGLKAGDCVCVKREKVADQGAFRDGDFKPLYQKEYDCPYLDLAHWLPVVSAATVNAAANSFIFTEDDLLYYKESLPAIENMEGAAFFSVCGSLNMTFLELRAVSNITTDSRGEWRIDLAAHSLAENLKKVIDAVKA